MEKRLEISYVSEKKGGEKSKIVGRGRLPSCYLKFKKRREKSPASEGKSLPAQAATIKANRKGGGGHCEDRKRRESEGILRRGRKKRAGVNREKEKRRWSALRYLGKKKKKVNSF